MSSGSPLWYLNRGSGVVALVLLTVVVVLGILTRAGQPLPGLPKFAVAEIHRNASLLSLAFLAIHVVTAVTDSYVSLTWADAIVPFTSSYHPLSVGLGALSLDLILAVVVTSLLRHVVGRRVFRVVHLTVYASWPIAIAHSIALGPDVRQGWQLGLAVVCIVTSAAALAWRLITVAPGKRREVLT